MGDTACSWATLEGEPTNLGKFVCSALQHGIETRFMPNRLELKVELFDRTRPRSTKIEVLILPEDSGLSIRHRLSRAITTLLDKREPSVSA